MADQIAINVKVIDSEVGPRLRAVRDQIKGAFADAERSAIAEFEANLFGNLYKLWRRLSSASRPQVAG
jgi:hypothetical protein